LVIRFAIEALDRVLVSMQMRRLLAINPSMIYREADHKAMKTLPQKDLQTSHDNISNPSVSKQTIVDPPNQRSGLDVAPEQATKWKKISNYPQVETTHATNLE
jgi:hypothetical protein